MVLEDEKVKYKKDIVFPLAIVGCGQFIVLTFIAMVFYTGGTRLDSTSPGYSFFTNFFSDLGRTVAYSGEWNLLSAALFIIALIGLGVSFLNYFMSIQQYFSETEEERKLTRIIVLSGKISALAFIGVAIVPANLFTLIHDLFVVVGFSFIMVVSGTMTALIIKTQKLSKSYVMVNVIFILILFIYAGLFLVIPEIITLEHLFVRATIQKVVVYSLILCFLIQSYGIWRNYNR